MNSVQWAVATRYYTTACQCSTIPITKTYKHLAADVLTAAYATSSQQNMYVSGAARAEPRHAGSVHTERAEKAAAQRRPSDTAVCRHRAAGERECASRPAERGRPLCGTAREATRASRQPQCQPSPTTTVTDAALSCSVQLPLETASCSARCGAVRVRCCT